MKPNERIKDTGWIDATLNSDVSNSWGSPLQYRRIGKIVHIRGIVTVNNPNLGKNITFLPEGFRPANGVGEECFICRCDEAYSYVLSIGQGDGALNVIHPSHTNEHPSTAKLYISFNFFTD